MYGPNIMFDDSIIRFFFVLLFECHDHWSLMMVMIIIKPFSFWLRFKSIYRNLTYHYYYYVKIVQNAVKKDLVILGLSDINETDIWHMCDRHSFSVILIIVHFDFNIIHTIECREYLKKETFFFLLRSINRTTKIFIDNFFLC